MADREDSAVKPVKVPVTDQPGDLGPAQPGRRELRARDDSVLTSRQ
jgi:hypothetical protein